MTLYSTSIMPTIGFGPIESPKHHFDVSSLYDLGIVSCPVPTPPFSAFVAAMTMKCWKQERRPVPLRDGRDLSSTRVTRKRGVNACLRPEKSCEPSICSLRYHGLSLAIYPPSTALRWREPRLPIIRPGRNSLSIANRLSIGLWMIAHFFFALFPKV